MADQNRRDNSQTDENARKATKGNDRDQSRNQGGMGEQDDVAEDRNLSGASTWLNLPDQPKNDRDASSSDDESSDDDNRTSRR